MISTRQVDTIIHDVLKEYADDQTDGVEYLVMTRVEKIDRFDSESRERIVARMMDKQLITRSRGEVNFTITEFGYEVLDNGGWLKYLNDSKTERTLDREIKQLTLKELKGNIFHLRYWWLLFVFSGLLSALFSWLFSLIDHNSG